MVRQPIVDFDENVPSATLNGPLKDPLPVLTPPPTTLLPETPKQQTVVQEKEVASYSTEQSNFTPEPSPPPGNELTLFLQYKTKVKKFVLAEGYNDLSLARLQLGFIDKFAWNTHNNGVDFPEIYIQDPVSGVRHELEDLSDIKDRSVLVLNIEVLDEVKRHIDEGLGGIKKSVESVRTTLQDQQAAIQLVSDRQQDTAKEVARIATVPPASFRAASSDNQRVNPSPMSPSKVTTQAQMSELQGLRRDLAIIKQTYSAWQSDIQSSMSLIRSKADSVKNVAIKAAIPDISGGSGRSYVNSGKKTLNDDSDKLVSQVDDLQDIVEDLRKDVVMRGVRPRPRLLETVAKDIAQATQDLNKMQNFLKREAPIWQKIWEQELETVCTDRELVTMQEDLAADLQDDLLKAQQTFALVEEATKEQMKDAPQGGSIAPRVLSKGLNHVITADPAAAKEGVLGEVRALQPNHENRLEAIERAEKLRQKELESRRGGEFQKELGTFVEEGRLKKSGGFEEVERARKAKDEKNRREVWERQNGMTTADADNFIEELAADEEDDMLKSEQDETARFGHGVWVCTCLWHEMSASGTETVGENAHLSLPRQWKAHAQIIWIRDSHVAAVANGCRGWKHNSKLASQSVNLRDMADTAEEPLMGQSSHEDDLDATDEVDLSDVSLLLEKNLRHPGVFVWLLTFSAGISGLLFGYDTGVISATLVSINSSLGHPLTTLDKSLITSATALFALLVSPVSGVLADSLVGFASPTLTSLSVALTNFVLTCLALLLIDRIGRRKILLYSIPIMSLGLLFCAIGFHFITLPENLSLDNPSSSANANEEIPLSERTAPMLVLASIMLYVGAYALGLGNVPWMQSELFPLNVRSFGSGLSTSTNWSANFVVGLTFLPMMEFLTPAWTTLFLGLATLA
ncbi:putative Bud site selection protein 6 [Glarea lozoyensis 74030]|uniref:Putative Bud site selection protein 6 n=1 Tax=Glarea lozoyensis (strain ATCC 74030 / MF5533) TaxID=1104152 RepID=H0ED45_GLAL7|nr:putative Bud site selection protein 6 [Glarea lozoyensis 74030]